MVERNGSTMQWWSQYGANGATAYPLRTAKDHFRKSCKSDEIFGEEKGGGA